jgi:NAD(P)-dependent dehydrogenase (short-subunit alcohol dehydrogenase family)
MASRLAGRVAIVTGASRGIGAAIADAFAAEGAAVAVAARTDVDATGANQGSLADVAARIAERGGTALAVRCDVAVADDLVALVERVNRELGPIDVLVNNAAAFGTNSLLAMPVKRFRICYEVNVFAPFRLMQLVMPSMADRGRGWIVNITSDAARRPPPGPYQRADAVGAPGYGSSKLALEHLTRSVAREFCDSGIAVNALTPSMPVATPSMLSVAPDLDEQVSAESFAEATIRLATCDPRELTGQVLYSEDVLHPELGVRGWLGTQI